MARVDRPRRPARVTGTGATWEALIAANIAMMAFQNRATANWGSGVGGQEETVAGERWADALEEVGCSRAIEPRPIRASAGWCDDWLGPPRPSR